MHFPSDFEPFPNIQIITFYGMSFAEIPEVFCGMNTLKVLEIYYSWSLRNVTQCIGELSNLEVVRWEYNTLLSAVPLSLFSLPNLKMMSLFKNGLTFESMLDFNIPSNITLNGSNSKIEWMSERFVYNDDTTYWLTGNPDLCANLSAIGVNTTKIDCADPCAIDVQSIPIIAEPFSEGFCSPAVYGDGKC